jgi:hypothetical protein
MVPGPCAHLQHGGIIESLNNTSMPAAVHERVYRLNVIIDRLKLLLVQVMLFTIDNIFTSVLY